MAALPVSYPSVPYVGMIPGGLRPGLMIRIIGEMNHYDRFNVDLQTGASLMDDINLHLSVRPQEQAIVRNHRVHNTFGQEERSGGCPIQYGQHFEILILAEMEQFKIAVNGRHFCEFRHRMAFSMVRFIHVGGAVKIHTIKLEGDSHPMMPSAPLMSSITTSVPSYPVQHQTLPYNHQPGPYGSLSTTITSTPSYQQSYPNGQYHYNPHPSYPSYPFNPSYPSPQQYPSPHQDRPRPKKEFDSKALKYAVGIGGIGLGAFALAKMFDKDSKCSSSSEVVEFVDL